MKKIFSIAGFASLLVLSATIESCHPKNSDAAPSSLDLISRTWKLTGQTTAGQDTYGSLDACEKDNLFTYTKDGKYTADEGPTKCSQSDPQTSDTGTYSFLQNNTMLKITSVDGTSLTFAVNQLTTTTLKLTFTINLNGQNYTVVSTFTAQ